MEYILTGFVIELNGKYLHNDWDRFAWDEDIRRATMFNETIKQTTDIVSETNPEYNNIKQGKLIPIKQITTYQLGEF